MLFGTDGIDADPGLAPDWANDVRAEPNDLTIDPGGALDGLNQAGLAGNASASVESEDRTGHWHPDGSLAPVRMEEGRGRVFGRTASLHVRRSGLTYDVAVDTSRICEKAV